MNIVPDTRKIAEIFPIETDIKYNVPPYQRNYSWDKNNIEELYNDVNAEERGYYIGNFIVTQNENNKEYLDIVDGQQRLTTVALFFLAIFEELQFLEDEEPKLKENMNAARIKVDIQRKLKTDQDEERIALLKPDSMIFKNYLNVFEGKEKGKFGDRIFGKRYKYIQGLLENKDIQDPIKKFEILSEFYNKLNAVILLQIKVDNITDAFTLFTSLNAKGMPLTLIDLLKSYYLGQSKQERIDDEEALIEWDVLIKIFMSNQNEPNSTAISQFLQNNYDAFEGEKLSSITKKGSLDAYKKLFQKKGHKYIETLLENAKLFSLVSPNIETDKSIEISNQTIINLLTKISRLEASPVYPLILYILKELKHKRIEENLVENILNYLLNFYVQRNIVLKPKSSNIRAKAIQVVRTLQNGTNSNKQSLNITKEVLGEIKPTEDEFKYALEGSVYDVSSKTTRLILIDIERKYGKARKYFNKQRPDNLDDKNEKGQLIWTLEHILPQTRELSAEWKEMISPDNLELASSVQIGNMHKLGNLTLTSYNSEMSDKNFVVKKDYRPDENSEYTGLRTGLFINDSIANEDIKTKENWTIEDINRRSNILSKLAVSIYSLEDID